MTSEETRLREQLAAEKNRSRNHFEGIKAIAELLRQGKPDHALQWAIGSLSGYTDTHESVTLKLQQQLAEVTQERDDYQEVHQDTQRLVRKLDVLWNGEAGAAQQASLCDMVSQIAQEWPEIRRRLATAQARITELNTTLRRTR